MKQIQPFQKHWLQLTSIVVCRLKLTEFMIAFEKKSPLILISATAMKVTFMKKLPEASVLSILKLASPLSMHNATRVKHFI